MLRKGVNKFQGYGWRGGSRAEASIICSRLRVSRWKSASLRRGRRCEGEARSRLYELDVLGGPVAPRTGSRYFVPRARAIRSHTVVRYADLDPRRLNHSSPHATPFVYEQTYTDLPTGFFRSRRFEHHSFTTGRAFMFHRKSIPRAPAGWLLISWSKRMRCGDAACPIDVYAVISLIDICYSRGKGKICITEITLSV